MGIWLSLNSNKRNADELVVFNGATETGFMVIQGGDWGMVDNTAIWSGSIDTEGSTKVGEKLENRTITLPFVIIGESTTDSINTRWAELADKIEEIREYKGTIRFRPSHATYGVNFEIEHIRLEGSYWGKSNELGGYRQVQIVATCRPYALMDPMDLEDNFSTDTFGVAGKYNNGGADWTADAGALANCAISGGALNGSANLSTENRFIHTGTQHAAGDTEVMTRSTVGSTISSQKNGVIVKRVDSSNYIEVYVDDNGVNSRIRIDVIIAGARTNVASTNLAARIISGAKLYVLGRIEGNVVYGEYWSAPPIPNTSATTSAVSGGYQLSIAEITALGKNISGRSGIVFTPQNASAKIEFFESKPFTYYSATWPDTIDINAEIPGNVDALASIDYSTGTELPTMMYSWWPKLPAYNMVLNDGFELTTGGWVVTAVAGVISAATSINSISTYAYEGAKCGQVVCPATTDTGASFALYKRFKRGVQYTASIYAKSASGTTAARVKLGLSGDLATGTATALSAAWTEYTVTWTPTADRDIAYLVFGINAATATTFEIDRCMVYEGTVAPETTDSFIGSPSTVTGGSPPYGIIEGESFNFGSIKTDVAASASYRSGRYATFNTNGGIPQWSILSSLAAAKSNGSTVIDVYARVAFVSTTTSPTMGTTLRRGVVVSNSLDGKSTAYSVSSLVPSSGTHSRIIKLGTFVLSDSGLDNFVEDISTTLTWTTTAPIIDYLVLVPVSNMCGSISGLPGSSVPTFCNANTKKTIESNLYGSFTPYTSSGYTPPLDGTGVVGNSITLTSGEYNTLLVWPSDYVIDKTDPLLTDNTLAYTGTVHVSVQPRLLMIGN